MLDEWRRKLGLISEIAEDARFADDIEHQSGGAG